ncbi:MAG: tRNA 5-methoxyuridine(34)/uridine 5-oxyacetic acid(34) synthase CmoB [Candidatus Omnitrophica bacterium]|nr:tRNA 5-methoxyuridine(34)/uridine 5-oxyacetic acid(34) synthase CmoB [Candidatus Omnitrophota bacterium]MCB9748312.1 tRNA 5-methoxyuridine(34)/uridine 5-oxyacetic acid(34) synthase CmoB [Candidatus Omnitrophota bacterium]
MQENTISFDYFYEALQEQSISLWLEELPRKIEQALTSSRWGDLPKWINVLERLPKIQPSSIDLTRDCIVIGRKEDCNEGIQKQLRELLFEFCPWRKGPFEIFDIHIDTEWRSDIKWNRLKDKIVPLKDKLVLDVGCGNGYHCWRMIGAGAKLVAGIDPTMLYALQFQLIQKYVQSQNVAVLPIGVDEMPENLSCFDTVFSMGLLYHRRSPLDHLLQLKSFLKPGGELVLESIVIDGKEGDVLSPKKRYAKMSNVWFIPSELTVVSWLNRMQFKNVRCIDVAPTTSQEQRVSEWSGNESLADFLDPHNSKKTLEGYPAPKRAVFLAQR